MNAYSSSAETRSWKHFEKLLFRVVFVYFLLQIFPLDTAFYNTLFHLDWSNIQYQDIFNLAHYATHIGAGQATFADWGILLLIALVAAAVWTYTDNNQTDNYNRLWYWLRVFARYRLALAVLAYGFIKFFPLQSPYPSISNLNTAYGDFNRWKLFSLSLGIVPGYESFLGLVEMLLALLLLNRRTAGIAAFLFLIFGGNVFMSNIAYEGGDTVYSLYLITLAMLIFSYDALRVFRLLILQLPTAAGPFKPTFTGNWRNVRLGLKSLFILLFIVVYGVKTSNGAKNDPYQFPAGKGLQGLAGIYNVSTFVINKDTLPYAPNDSIRWKDVVFEEWNTLSIRTNQPVTIDENNRHLVPKGDEARNYEAEGTNARRYYSYRADTLQDRLLLTNKNPHYPADSIALQLVRTGADQLRLAGRTAAGDSLWVVLDKLPKQYLLKEAASGRTKKLKL
ncbi:DoxX family protein [Chitinophaga sp. Cy-1792]|uniref:DoxX family protein n=1 Tax=Chitinophaga sp. Cy-1792 TaxID=2608339 RepID=UPI0014232A98|nr:DoxX family protein [Chitinophaga sp. Cy-1792]NIG55953.1 DoxX family protein [Chitinophaga sp. Cy-1792]